MSWLKIIFFTGLALPAITWASDPCSQARIEVSTVKPNGFIGGRVVGLSPDELAQYRLIFYVKTDIWYLHSYVAKDGQYLNGFSYADFYNLNTDQADFRIKTVLREYPASKAVAILVPKGLGVPAMARGLSRLTELACAVQYFDPAGKL